MKNLIAFLAVVFIAASTTFARDISRFWMNGDGRIDRDVPAVESKLADALTKAKAANKPVIAIFHANWCAPCMAMQSVIASEAVKPFRDKFIWAYLDADEAANDADMKKLKVRSIPHLEFLDSEGNSIGQQVGACPAADFAKKLDEAIKKVGGKD